MILRVFLLPVVFLITSCADFQNNASVGALSGALLGGAIGHQVGKGGGKTALTIGGAILGAHLGAQLGRDFDEQTQHQMFKTLDEVPKHRSRSWRTGKGERMTMTPTHTYRDQDGFVAVLN